MGGANTSSGTFFSNYYFIFESKKQLDMLDILSCVWNREKLGGNNS